jgi:hypothetical protein
MTPPLEIYTAEDVATAWCDPENAHKEMDVVLAQSILKRVNEKLRDPLFIERILKESGYLEGLEKRLGHYHTGEKDFCLCVSKQDTHEVRLLMPRRIEDK